MTGMQVVFITLLILMHDCAIGFGEEGRGLEISDDPVLDYFIHLQKQVTDGNGRLTVNSFPAAVFGLTDYDVKTGLTTREISDLNTVTCIKSSTCKLDLFMFNWVAKGDAGASPLSKVKIRVFKKLEQPLGPQELKVDISAAVVIQDAISSDLSTSSETPPRNISFTCADKKWVHITTLDIGAESEDGWLELNLTAAVQSKWLSNASGSLIQIALKLNSTLPIPLTLVNPSMSNLTNLDKKQQLQRRPYLLLFLEEQLKMNVTQTKSANIVRRPAHSERRKRSSKNGCNLLNYTVNFAELGLTTIIAPSTLNIGICSGECRFSFLSTFPGRGSNHATIMSRAFDVHADASSATTPRPKNPCCVPDKFVGVLILEAIPVTPHYSFFAIRIFEQLVATACKCL